MLLLGAMLSLEERSANDWGGDVDRSALSRSDSIETVDRIVRLLCYTRKAVGRWRSLSPENRITH
jgi:hypothetical protein